MSKELDKLQEDLQKEVDLDKRKKALFEKDLILREHRVGRDLEAFNQNAAELEQAKTVVFGQMTQENIAPAINHLNFCIKFFILLNSKDAINRRWPY